NVLLNGVNCYILAVLVFADLDTGTETGPVHFTTTFLDSIVLFIAAPEDKSGRRKLKSFSYKIFRDFYNVGFLVDFAAIFFEDLPCFGIRNLNTWVHQNFHGCIVNCLKFVISKKV